MTKETGGYAYPTSIQEAGGTGIVYGMTLRDYFAAQSLAGLLGRSWDTHNNTGEQVIAMWARSAYAVADAMLVERNRD